jgi:hypothetical protein
MTYQIKALSFAEMLDAAFRIIRDHFVVLVGLSAVVHVPIAILQDQIGETPGQIAWGRAAVAFGLSLIGAPIVATALTHAIGELYLGRPASISASLRASLAIIVPLSGTMLLVYLGTFVGFLLLIVPGIYLSLAWMLTWPVTVLEHRFGATALGRSRELMQQNMLRALGIVILGWLIVVVVSATLGVALHLVPVLGPVVQGVARSIGVAYSSVVLVLLYFDIRCRKEAFDLEHLAQLVEGPPAAAVA